MIYFLENYRVVFFFAERFLVCNLNLSKDLES